MTMNQAYFVDLILPLPLKTVFTYRLSSAEFAQLKVGCRVAVPFGSKKTFMGVVYRLHHDPPHLYKARAIHQIIDEEPIITNLQIAFWEFIAQYYLCAIGDVCRRALPSSLLIDSELIITRTNREVEEVLNQEEQEIVDRLSVRSSMFVQEIQKEVSSNQILKTIKGLLDKGLVVVYEQIREKYQPKLDTFIRISSDVMSNEQNLKRIFEALSKAQKQREIFMQLVQLSHEDKPVRLATLLEITKTSRTVLNELIKKEIVERYTLPVDRIKREEMIKNKVSEESFEEIKSELKESLEEYQVTLFQGLEAQDKLTFYIALCQQSLVQQQRVLLVLPELAMTIQLIEKLKYSFGDNLGVFHAKLNSNEQAEVWLNTFNEKYDLMVGTRSALFLPFKALDLVIVDQENEESYKQNLAPPFYQGRDMAVVLAKQFQAKTILVSSIPSLETIYNVKQNKYGQVFFKGKKSFKRPEITLIDLKKAYKEKEMNGHFSNSLCSAIANCLEEKMQAIIFQNKGGYAPVVTCQTCGHVTHCPNCDVSLTLHKSSPKMKCHICAYTQAIPRICPACHSTNLSSKGVGTEQIEQELTALFPAAVIERVDADSMRKKYAFEQLFERVQAKEIDILVGTQMLAKGLDFERVGLVGVIQVDRLLHYPDFRANERTFQFLSQLSEKLGKVNMKRKMLIQSFQPNHQVLQQFSVHDYDQMVTETLYERKQFLYPPFCRLITIGLQHKSQERVMQSANYLKELLAPIFGRYLLGPEAPLVERARNKYRQKILLKLTHQTELSKIKRHIVHATEKVHSISPFKSVEIMIDVDPYRFQ